ncbi:MAG TPA: adenylosuccinate lyase family protein [Streptosporangiaceae bacterium]|nr:adenylosuccinate lyase family protein [Streptosporangiaceae bacterium]
MLDFDGTFAAWIAVELALAESQAELGLLDDAVIEEIRQLRDQRPADLEKFRQSAMNVGYPIVGLVELLNEDLPPSARGYLHLGATTQDIMDSAAALQVRDAGRILCEQLTGYGDLLADLTQRHAATPMAGRTHAHHAVPTTFGLKCAVYLGEATRNLERMRAAIDRAAIVSLFGAAGTSAALGPHAAELRVCVAARLGLGTADLPWHVSRDRFAEVAFSCALTCASLARLAREVIDLSRTEIGEVSESDGWHRGASSTMPQKRNPVSCEAVLGMALAAQGSAALMMRAMEAGHERAAGEWQLEWKALPETLRGTSSALVLAIGLLHGLAVHPDTMLRNLSLDHGLVMAEAYMLGLARTVGREAAHDLLYRAARVAREEDVALPEALLQIEPAAASTFPQWPVEVTSYLGEARPACQAAVAAWAATRDGGQPHRDGGQPYREAAPIP